MSANSHTVLLIDDDDSVASGLTKILQRHGVAVTRAKDGAEGVRILSAKTFDLVITDIFMDRMDGLEVLMFLKESFPGTKVVAISGGDRGGEIDGLRMARHLGAAMVLNKPISAAELSSVIAKFGIGKPSDRDDSVALDGLRCP